MMSFKIQKVQVQFVQFLMSDSEVVQQLGAVVPDVPNLGGVFEPNLPKLVEVDCVPAQKYKAKTSKMIKDKSSTNLPHAESEPSQPAAPAEEVELEATDNNMSFSDEEQLVAFNSQEEIHALFGTGELDEGFQQIPPLEPILHSCHAEVFIVDKDFEDEAAELVFPPCCTQYLVNKSVHVPDGHGLVFRYGFEQIPEVVIQRVNNTISQEEALGHVEECRVAMIRELERWNRHKAWVRRSKQGSQNALASKWVLKWKSMADASTGVKARGIKARLVVQGFRDKQSVNNYSGTTSRWAQRLLIALSVQFRWRLISMDVSEAFLRGISFKELHEEDPSKPLRTVQVILPPGSGELLRSLKGMESFNEEAEVLEMLKPGFGLKDAPRLWGLALKRVLKEIGARPITIDPQLFVKHDARKSLILAISVHVDDLKMTGLESEMTEAKRILESHVDELKTEIDTFEHLGLRHDLCSDGSRTVSQAHYIRELRTIPDADLRHNPKEPVNDRLQKLYMSLLGGLTWTVQTRLDIAVFVAALQRKLKAPTGQDIVDLNRVVRYVQNNPAHLKISRVNSP